MTRYLSLTAATCAAALTAGAVSAATLPPVALAHIKEVVLAGADLPLDAALALERRAFHMLFDTADQKEGMAAFLEKRPARFTGE